MRRLIALMLSMAVALPAIANEGMWLPMLLGRNYQDMKEHGLQLTPEEIYSINEGSLKDAIVSFGGFCTGEIISSQGLILTNHHCGYDAIQTHSTEENNYLKDGFWAKTLQDEIPNEGLFVRFLVRMEDVSNKVLDQLNDGMSEQERAAKIQEVGKKLAAEATEGSNLEASVESFYHGNEFYLFVYERFNDIRLVGAPPSSIGKFGGDTDNWMWPRHTGDFSMFRVYASPSNEPAAYAEENIPYQPKHHLPVSINGVQPGDFTMVMGYPGSTDRYLSSYGVKQAIEKYNPTVVNIRDKKLKVMKKYMKQNEAVDIQYASKYARTSNYWKYYIGQTEQLKNNKVYDEKAQIEKDFAAWVSASPSREKKYGETLNLLEEAYAEKDNYVQAKVYVLEAGLIGPELPLFAFRMNRFVEAYFATDSTMEAQLDAAETDSAEAAIKTQFTGRLEGLKARILNYASEFYGDYHQPLDQELMAELFEMYYTNVPKDQHPDFFAGIADEYDGDFNEYAEEVFEESVLTSMEKLEEFLDDPDQEDFQEDPAVLAGNSLFKLYQEGGKAHQATEDKLTRGYRLLTAGLREMNPEKSFAPDANSTMRITYGTVNGYQARDAVEYAYYTTAEGILQKMDNTDDEFKVPEKLEKLIKQGDFGRYANEKGELPVNFIHNTDITGGNSGSPVINGKGHLIGCAFDGNWEAMSGDIFFEDELQRTISVDARYILFVVEKYAQAYRLVQEMTIVDNRADKPAKTSERKAEREPAGI